MGHLIYPFTIQDKSSASYVRTLAHYSMSAFIKGLRITWNLFRFLKVLCNYLPSIYTLGILKLVVHKEVFHFLQFIKLYLSNIMIKMFTIILSKFSSRRDLPSSSTSHSSTLTAYFDVLTLTPFSFCFVFCLSVS